MNRSTPTSTTWRRATSVVAVVGLLVSCGSDDDSATTADTEPAGNTAAAPSSPATTVADAPAGGVGQAVVEVGADRYEFVVIQCLRDVTGPLSDAVIEFQLDGVPAATPPDVIEGLLGVIGDDVDVFAELEPVVEFGPILSITQLAGGGEAFYVTDLDTIEITSDGDPTEPASRSLDVSSDASGARVTGTSTAGGQTVAIDATCP